MNKLKNVYCITCIHRRPDPHPLQSKTHNTFQFPLWNRKRKYTKTNTEQSTFAHAHTESTVELDTTFYRLSIKWANCTTTIIIDITWNRRYILCWWKQFSCTGFLHFPCLPHTIFFSFVTFSFLSSTPPNLQFYLSLCRCRIAILCSFVANMFFLGGAVVVSLLNESLAQCFWHLRCCKLIELTGLS